MPTIQVDVIQVNDIVRPLYEEAYYQQSIPKKAREVSYDKKGIDPKPVNTDIDSEGNFKANYELMGNVFRTGVSRSSPKFRDTPVYDYSGDRFQKPIRTFTVTRVYNSEKNRWKTTQDMENDVNATRG